MANKNFNLQVELTAKIDDLTAKLNSANQKINQLKNTSKSTGSNDVFSGLMKSAGAYAAGLITVNAAMSAFEGVIGTTQTAGDSWAVTVAGMHGALEGVYRTIGTGDWDNLFGNMVRSAAAARDLAIALDELQEQGNAANLNNSQIDFQIAELEKVRNVAKANKDYSKVIETAQQIGNLEMQKLNNQLFVAEKERTAFFKDIQTITGLDQSTIVDFIQNYNDANVEEIRNMASAYNDAIDEINTTKSRLQFAGVDQQVIESNYRNEINALNGKTSKEVQIYAATMRKYNSLNDEKINNAVKAEQKIWELKTQSTKQQISNEVALAKAKNKEDDYGNRQTTTKNEIKTEVKLTGLDALKAELTNLQKQQDSALTIDAAIAFNEPIEATKQRIKDWEKAVNPDNIEIAVELKGLPLLEKQLSELQQAQQNSQSSEQYKDFTEQIQAKQQAIRDFKGEVEATNDVLIDSSELTSNYLDAIGNSFNAMSNAMSATGNEGAAKFFSMIGAINDMVGAINELGSMMAAQQAIEQAAAAQKVATAGTTIAAEGAVAQASAVRSGAAMPFPLNLLAIAAGIAAVVSAMASISKFETGGIVGGNSFIGDNNLVRVNSGEMILNQRQQANLFKQLNSNQSQLVNGQVRFKIDGSTLVGVLNNHGRKINSYK